MISLLHTQDHEPARPGVCPSSVHELRYGFMMAVVDPARVIFPKTGLSGSSGACSVICIDFGGHTWDVLQLLVHIFFDARTIYYFINKITVIKLQLPRSSCRMRTGLVFREANIHCRNLGRGRVLRMVHLWLLNWTLCGPTGTKGFGSSARVGTSSGQSS